MSNPRRSSIAIGSSSVGSKDTSESGRTEIAPAQNVSSSSQTPQFGTEPPSAGEGSVTSSRPQVRDTIPSLDVPVIPICLPVPPANVENFVPFSRPPGSEEKNEDPLLNPEHFNTSTEYQKYVIHETEPDSTSIKVSELLKLKMEESPSSPIVCAPVVVSTPSTELLCSSCWKPKLTTPSSEVSVVKSQNTSAPTTVNLTEIHSTPPIPFLEVPTRGVIHIPPTNGQTPQQGQVFFSAPAAWQVLSAPQHNTYQAPSQTQELDSPFVSVQQRTKAKTLVLNAGIELMQEDPVPISPNELIAALSPFWSAKIVDDHGVRIDPATLSKVPQDPRLLGVTPSNTPLVPQYSNSLLIESMVGTQDRDRDRQKGGRPREPTLAANNDKNCIGKFKPAGSSKVAPAHLSKRSKTQIKQEREKAGLYRYCGILGHTIKECPEPDCQRTKQWPDSNPEAVQAYLARGSTSSRSRGGPRNRGKGSSSSSNRIYKYSLFSKEQDSCPTSKTPKKQTSVSKPWIKCLTHPLTTLHYKTATPNETLYRPCFNSKFDRSPDLQSHNDIFMVRTSDIARRNLKLKFLINNCEIGGIIDSRASSSKITVVLAEKCKMEKTSHCINFKSANNILSKSLESAEGTLSFRLRSVTQLVHVKHSLAIIPGNNMLLIGRDLLHHLGLLNDEGLFSKMDEEHRTLLLPKAEFDH
ncbi:hypothetical protein P9112_003997 [Eukaryota sp. TZLM1-RC]